MERSGRLARWRLWLSEFEFDVIRRAGIKHQAPGVLSRLPTSREDNKPLEDALPLLLMNMRHSLGDTQICVNQTTINDALSPENDNAEVLLDTPPTDIAFPMEQAHDAYCKTVTLWIGCQVSEFSHDNPGLFIRESSFVEIAQIVVSESIRSQILCLSHHPSISWHPGQRREHETPRRSATYHVWIKTFTWQSLSLQAVQRTEASTDKRDVFRYSLQKNL